MRTVGKSQQFHLMNDFGRVVSVLTFEEGDGDDRDDYLYIAVYDTRLVPNTGWTKERVWEREFRGECRLEKLIVTKGNRFEVVFTVNGERHEVVIEP